MKKLFFLFVMLLTLPVLHAQQMLPVPLDPAVKLGKLPNGLTYYIRRNVWPEKRADFYIAQRVGSVQEEDSQRGLAHFLEHMCFNGTTHFPGDGLKQYLERIGVKFGENLNAYTSFDETVYNINNVNVEITGAVDSCLLILHDWSHDLLLEDEEIDKERGVIEEEWRVRRSASLRVIEKTLSAVCKDSKYGARMPIGTMEVVKNFPYDTLRSYYRRWYRPDLQALVIVGDVDPDDIERRIRNLFADIAPAAADAPARVTYDVPDNKEPIVYIGSDKEYTSQDAVIMFKRPVYPREERDRMQYLLVDFIQSAIASMLNERIDELARQADAPFAGAGVDYENFFGSAKASLNLSVSMKEGHCLEGIKAAYRELLRAHRGGFTSSEFERYKQEYLSQIDAAYEARSKRTNTSLVTGCVRHFLDNEPNPGIEFLHSVAHEYLPLIPLSMVNDVIFSDPLDNRIIYVITPEKEGQSLLTEQELLGAMAEVEAEEIEPYSEDVSTAPLVPALKSKVKVKKITDDIFGAKLITLSNGMKIHVLKTNYSPNRISLRATSWGGNSLYSNDEYLNVSRADMIKIGGWGDFSDVELSKKLSGKQVSASPSIGTRTESIDAGCVKKDLETMLQLVYLCFTAPRRDDAAYASQIQRMRNALQNKELNPLVTFSDSIASILYDNNVRAKRMRLADLDALSYDRMLQVYRERFANAADFEFYLVGDVDADTVAPLLAKYIGALPAKGKKEAYKTVDQRIRKGQHDCIFTKEQDTPNSINIFFYHAPVKETLKNSILVSMLQQSLQILFTENVREENGGAYSVPVNASLNDYPEEVATVTIELPTAPEKREIMTQVIYDGVREMMEKGPSAENLDKIKQYMLRSHQENLKNNAYWLNNLYLCTRYGMNYVDGYDETVKSITAEDVRALSETVFGSGNRIAIGMETPAQ